MRVTAPVWGRRSACRSSTLGSMLGSDVQAAITTGYCHRPLGRGAAPNPLFNFYRTRDGRPRRVVGSAVPFTATPAAARGAAAELGEQTEEVLLEAGYGWEDIARLKELGVLG